jgi:2-polyprenylphenol 6-hydroxylase
MHSRSEDIHRNADAPFDVAIVGGGTVGAALALALRDAQLRVALLSPEPVSIPSGAAFDPRVYAVSPANVAFLKELGAWDRIDPARLTAVHAMRVYGDAPATRIEFDAYRSGDSALAWIVEDSRLQAAISAELVRQATIERIKTSMRALEVADEYATLALDGGRRLRARLVVGADGARSVVRGQAGIDSVAQDYGQRAVVGNFSCARPHEGIAWQWFLGGPVLALLPLPGDHVSMVWSTSQAEAERLGRLDGEGLAREVSAASGQALGELHPVTAQRSYPLQRLSARHMIAQRIALVGDAAHVIHPLAGQGANLGLQDARVLAQVLSSREPARDPGELRLLRRYERERAEATLAMQVTVHGLYRLFGAQAPGLGRLRNAGLNLADRIPVLKNLLMRHAMG